MVWSEAGSGAPCQGERRLELTVPLKTGRHRVLQLHLMVAVCHSPWGRHQLSRATYGLSPLPKVPQVWDAEAAPWDVALLGTDPFIFPELLPNLLLFPSGRTSLTAGWVLSPSLAGPAPEEDTTIKAIYSLWMEPPSPAGERFPITWTNLPSLICHYLC